MKHISCNLVYGGQQPAPAGLHWKEVCYIGLGVLQAGAMFFFVYAGASQFTSLGILSGGV